jgi:hypothetical protein
MHIYVGNENIYEIKTTVPVVAPHRCGLIAMEIYLYVVEIDLDGDLYGVVEILMETEWKFIKDLEFWNDPDESLSNRRFDLLHKCRDRKIIVLPRNTSLQYF